MHSEAPAVSAPPFFSHIPRAPLCEWVEFFWIAEHRAHLHVHERLLPTGTVDLVFTLGRDGRLRSNVWGARSEFLLLDASAPFTAIGVRFKPGGGVPFFNLPAGDLHNGVAPLEYCWGTSAGVIADRLWSEKSPTARFEILEGALLHVAAGRFDGHPAVRHGFAPHKVRARSRRWPNRQGSLRGGLSKYSAVESDFRRRSFAGFSGSMPCCARSSANRS